MYPFLMISEFPLQYYTETYTCKNHTTYRKSASKSSTSWVFPACYKLSISLEQVVNNLQQPCWYCKTCYKVVPTRLLQSWYNNIATTLCRQTCNILVISWLYQTCESNLVTSLIMPSSLLQVVNNLFQTCCNKLGTSSANTTCWQLVNRLVTNCLQTCYNLFVFTRAAGNLPIHVSFLHDIDGM